MSSEVIEGHMRSPFYLNDKFCLKSNLIKKTLKNIHMPKTQIYLIMKFELKGHLMSHKVW